MQKSNLDSHECKATAILNILSGEAWVRRCQVGKFDRFYGLAPPKIQSGFAQPILNHSSWIFLSGVFHEFEQFSWFWNKSVLSNHPSEHETTWPYHFQVVSSSYCNLNLNEGRCVLMLIKLNEGLYVLMLINFVCANFFFFSVKEKFIQFFFVVFCLNYY